jgi:hypothetical protein
MSQPGRLRYLFMAQEKAEQTLTGANALRIWVSRGYLLVSVSAPALFSALGF